jgi:predicted transcriptional regulator
MKTMLIEYDGRNKTVKQLLESLITSGLIHRKDTPLKSKRAAEFEQALHEAKAMADDIAINGPGGYKTMDDLLNEISETEKAS